MRGRNGGIFKTADKSVDKTKIRGVIKLLEHQNHGIFTSKCL